MTTHISTILAISLSFTLGTIATSQAEPALPTNAEMCEPAIKAKSFGDNLYMYSDAFGAPVTDDDERIIRAYVKSWTGDKAPSTTDRTLQLFNLTRLKQSDPTLARILGASPVGIPARWCPQGDDKRHHLIEVVDLVAPLPAPENLNAIPSNALKLEGGVRLQRLGAGSGASPTLDDMVEVHYSGWTLDGKMFDSSRLREAPNTFPLSKLIKGWQIALPNMKVGGMARIWIPGDYAYDKRPDRPHAPKGMLVFDVELIGVSAATDE